MIRIHPFAALRPSSAHAAEVASDPYDVISTAEARERATGKPRSFLHVVRSEIDLPPETDDHAPVVYEQAARNLQQMITAGTLVRDPAPGLYLYRQVREGKAQTGIVCCVEAAQYDSGEIRKHEKTRPDKEDEACDRAQQGGFAAARGADQHTHFAGAQAQTHLVDRRLASTRVLNLQLRNL